MLLSTEVGQQKESNHDLPSGSGLCSCQRAAGVGRAWPLAGLCGAQGGSPHLAGGGMSPAAAQGTCIDGRGRIDSRTLALLTSADMLTRVMGRIHVSLPLLMKLNTF